MVNCTSNTTILCTMAKDFSHNQSKLAAHHGSQHKSDQ